MLGQDVPLSGYIELDISLPLEDAGTDGSFLRSL